MHTQGSSTDGGTPVARTRITLKNVPGFIHQHMPVREIVSGQVTPLQVNRDDVVTLEPVAQNESPERGCCTWQP